MRHAQPRLIVLIPALAVAAAAPCAAVELTVAHLYNLSDFSGTIPYNYAGLHVDREHDEIYVLYRNVVRIFNADGMEVFRFGNHDDRSVGLDVTVDDAGDIYTLARGIGRAHAGTVVHRRNYRGELRTTLVPEGLPAEWTDFTPSRIFHNRGRLLLVDTGSMVAAEIDLDGALLRAHDLGGMAGIAAEERAGTQISGFDWDREGNMLMTVPVAFRAFVVSPQGTVRGFGKPGSIPGTFGVVAGITRDEHGRYYVADRLHSVVMIFDPDFEFITEFGYRGPAASNLIAPNTVAVDDSGRLYVTQLRNRGVAVFAVHASGPSERDDVQASGRKEVPQVPNRPFQQELHSSPGDGRPAASPDLQSTGSAGALGGPPLGGGMS